MDTSSAATQKTTSIFSLTSLLRHGRPPRTAGSLQPSISERLSPKPKPHATEGFREAFVV
eukprot:5890353-Pyramimonas_sp.AAC.1